jgi:hypothetical protein
VLKKGFHAVHYAEVCGIRSSNLVAYSHGHMAQLFNKLMISLGYSEYVTQGGDWGRTVRNPYGLLYGADDVPF